MGTRTVSCPVCVSWNVLTCPYGWFWPWLWVVSPYACNDLNSPEFWRETFCRSAVLPFLCIWLLSSTLAWELHPIGLRFHLFTLKNQPNSTWSPLPKTLSGNSLKAVNWAIKRITSFVAHLQRSLFSLPGVQSPEIHYFSRLSGVGVVSERG